jgi:hypothetical protein
LNFKKCDVSKRFIAMGTAVKVAPVDSMSNLESAELLSGSFSNSGKFSKYSSEKEVRSHLSPLSD